MSRAAGVVLVTGTSSGIGRVTAAHLDRAGFRVLAGVRRDEDAEAISRESSGRIAPLRLDVTDPDAIEGARRRVQEETGAAGLAGLVNNAGISIDGPLEFADLDAMRRQFDVNVFGPTALTKALLPALRRARGRVVNVSSGLGRSAMPLVGAYCASKFALEALSDALRIELRGGGVRVVVIEPGVVATGMHESTRAASRSVLEELPEEGRALYARAFERRRESSERFERGATSPEAVARAIHRALTTRSPRARYAVGLDARSLVTIARFLPDRAKDAIWGLLSGL